VQGVIKLVLEAIYEPSMSIDSHGFRPGKSQHSALRSIRKNFDGVKWIIEGDITKFFDTLNWEVLISILRKRIKDEKFLKLIQKGLKAKIILPDGLVSIPNKCTSQGEIVSPLLSNIYLDQMDFYIKKYQNDFNKGIKRANSVAYTLRKMGVSEVIKQGFKKTNTLDLNFRKLHYVRYADAFLIGIIGSKEESKKIKNDLSEFLRVNLKLLLHPEKTLITNTKDYVKFLGFAVGFKKISYKLRVNNTYKPACRKRLTLMVDMDKVIKKLAEAKFCKLNGDPLPCFQYLHQSQSISLLRVNAILRGYVNYFRLCNNFRRSLNRIKYILQHSLAKMFAAKFKLKTRAAVFKVSGPTLKKRLGPTKVKRAIGATDYQLDSGNNFIKSDLATISKKKF
jgi:group II intron reverse transcriptase/maturase